LKVGIIAKVGDVIPGPGGKVIDCENPVSVG
jgi:hypothetical protein